MFRSEHKVFILFLIVRLWRRSQFVCGSKKLVKFEVLIRIIDDISDIDPGGELKVLRLLMIVWLEGVYEERVSDLRVFVIAYLFLLEVVHGPFELASRNSIIAEALRL